MSKGHKVEIASNRLDPVEISGEEEQKSREEKEKKQNKTRRRRMSQG